MTFIGTISQVLREIAAHVNKLITDLQTIIPRTPKICHIWPMHTVQELLEAHSASQWKFVMSVPECSVPHSTRWSLFCYLLLDVVRTTSLRRWTRDSQTTQYKPCQLIYCRSWISEATKFLLVGSTHCSIIDDQQTFLNAHLMSCCNDINNWMKFLLPKEFSAWVKNDPLWAF